MRNNQPALTALFMEQDNNAVTRARNRNIISNIKMIDFRHIDRWNVRHDSVVSFAS